MDRRTRTANDGWASRLVAVAASLALATAPAACRDAPPATLGLVIGSEGERAARIAVADINASGGVSGRPLAVRGFARAYDPSAQIALRIADSLVADPSVFAVVGHANSSASLAAAQVYNARQLSQIAPTSTTPLYATAGPYSFRLVASDEHQARFLAREVERQAGARVAVVYVNDDYGRALRGMLVTALAASGVRPVYDAGYVERDSTNGPAELVRSLAAANPTLLVWVGRAGEYAQISARLRAALPGLAVLASDGFGGYAIETHLAPHVVGVRYVRLVDVGRADTALQRVRATYRRSGPGDLTDQAALTYDAVRLAAAAANAVGPDRGRVREWLSRVGREDPPFRGITGPIAFLDNGDRAPTFVLVIAGEPASAGEPATARSQP